jgi:hypothetical protein
MCRRYSAPSRHVDRRVLVGVVVSAVASHWDAIEGGDARRKIWHGGASG